MGLPKIISLPSLVMYHAMDCLLVVRRVYRMPHLSFRQRSGIIFLGLVLPVIGNRLTHLILDYQSPVGGTGSPTVKSLRAKEKVGRACVPEYRASI